MAKSLYASAMASSKPQAGDKYIVRFPDGMRERIADAAKGSNRSINAEIVARLEASFSTPSEPYATQSQLERVFKKIAQDRKAADFLNASIRDLLATYVVQLYEALPPSSAARPQYQVAHGFASTLRTPENPGLEEMLTKIVPGEEHAAAIGPIAGLLRYTTKLLHEGKKDESAILGDD